jgi:hypothetical protein
MKNPSIEGFFYGLEFSALAALKKPERLVEHRTGSVELVPVPASAGKRQVA